MVINDKEEVFPKGLYVLSETLLVKNNIVY